MTIAEVRINAECEMTIAELKSLPQRLNSSAIGIPTSEFKNSEIEIPKRRSLLEHR